MAKGALWKFRRKKADREPSSATRDTPVMPEDAVPLRQLLGVATLTPAQAALLARDVIGGVEALRRLGPDGVVFDTGSVRLTSSGHVGFAPMWYDGSQRASDAAAALLDELIGNVRNGSAQRRDAVSHIERLGDANGNLTSLANRVNEVAAELLNGEAGPRVRHVRRGLGALVTASLGLERGSEDAARRPEVIQPAPAPAVMPRITKLPRSQRMPRRRIFHSRRRGRGWKVPLAAAVAAAVVVAGWWGAPRVWAELEDGWDELFGASNPPPTEIDPVSPPPESEDDDGEAGEGDGDTTDDESALADVEPPAPESAGAINEVSLEAADGTCEADQPCPVRVEVDLEPAASSRQVTWSFDVVDRCGEDVATQPGVTVTAQAGWTSVWGDSQVDVPSGTALAIMAVTESPANASSSPLLIPEDDGTC
ncbi:hypothetical protein EF847_12285 [Actinobacteria bacterium YIM 96077]|uniref:Uncharacterized protein n=1 Tax=Phytoactinopolyspora halophila TaxID=1981511 RepID=A0A329QYF3_9ACTN|nr:hypothetical protein [Phytoactinopolyspora halophila]AYY13355.1 hypothetical protein EF847_12285 [Actinobacteria bacterium YIM 96077]RAW17410.1 hypothetical protein DPM12_05150 [Phytoactinopolyspora halophila]